MFRNEQPLGYLYPERRLYLVRQDILSETAILPGLFADWLITLGEQLKDTPEQERWMVRIQYQPFVRLVWLGAILIASAAALSGTRKLFKHRFSNQESMRNTS